MTICYLLPSNSATEQPADHIGCSIYLFFVAFEAQVSVWLLKHLAKVLRCQFFSKKSRTQWWKLSDYESFSKGI